MWFMSNAFPLSTFIFAPPPPTPHAKVRFLFGSLIVYIVRMSAFDPCTSGANCMRALQQHARNITSLSTPGTSSSPTPNLSSQAARSESAANLLRVFICTNSPTGLNLSPCPQPNLADCLLQLIMYQLRYSPAECARQSTPSNTAVSSSGVDSKSFSPTQPVGPPHSSDATGYGSPGKNTPGTSYTKSNTRFSSHHPLVWCQYFSIFLDYATTDEIARKRLLRLGVPELFLR